MISFKKSIFPHFSVKIDAEHLSSIVNFSNLLQAAHAYPSGLKRHSWRENAFKEANFSKILLYILQKNFFLNFSKSQFFLFFYSSLGHGESIGTLGLKIGPQIWPGQKCTYLHIAYKLRGLI